MSRAAFDPVIHPPNRLRICALLADVSELEFAVLRDSLSVSDSVLSKQLAALAEAGYVRSRRARREARQRVWVSLTRAGRSAYTGHVRALQEIVNSTHQERTAGRTVLQPTTEGGAG